MADFVNMIPGGGWRAVLDMKDGTVRDVPLVGWALSEYDTATPFFYPGEGWCATVLSMPAITENPQWGITVYRIYHPDQRTEGTPQEPLPESSWPVVHLMITDPDDPDYGEVFTACCGVNWRAVTGNGMITANRNLVTCTGKHPMAERNRPLPRDLGGIPWDPQ